MDWNDLGSVFTELVGDKDDGTFPIPGPAISLSARTSRTLNAIFQNGTEAAYWKWVAGFKDLESTRANDWVQGWPGEASTFYAYYPYFKLTYPYKDIYIRAQNRGENQLLDPAARFLKDAYWIVDRLNQIIDIKKSTLLTADDKTHLMQGLNVSGDDFDLTDQAQADNFQKSVINVRDNLLSEIVLFSKTGWPPASYKSPFDAFKQSLGADIKKAIDSVKTAVTFGSDLIPWVVGGAVLLYVLTLFKK
jgi:hypothetical protein